MTTETAAIGAHIDALTAAKNALVKSAFLLAGSHPELGSNADTADVERLKVCAHTFHSSLQALEICFNEYGGKMSLARRKHTQSVLAESNELLACLQFS